MEGSNEIADEIRHRIYALYWGQRIVGTNGWPDYGEGRHLLLAVPENSFGNYMWLKPLSSIADEDAKELVDFIMANWDNFSGLQIENVYDWLEDILNGNCALFSDYVSGYEMIDIIDFLRSKGYALPACGFTVNELVEAGVYKLKEVSNG